MTTGSCDWCFKSTGYRTHLYILLELYTPEAQNLRLEKNLSERRSPRAEKESWTFKLNQDRVLCFVYIKCNQNLKMYVLSQLLVRLERNVEEYVAGEFFK